MTLPLAIRPRIRLRDEPERPRAQWLPPKALPIAAYWAVMGVASYGVSKGPSWFPSEETRPTHGAVDTSPVQPLTRVVAQSDTPPVRSELPPIREEIPAVHREAPPVLSTVDEPPKPTKLPRTSVRQSLLEPPPAFSTARAPRDPERTRDGRGSRHDGRPAGDSLETTHTGSLALHFDPVPQDSYPVRDELALGPLFPAPTDDPPAAVRAMPHARSTLPSCESAVSAANTEWDLTGARGAPDLSRDAYASVLEHGAYFSHCAVPAGTALDICAAVQKGRPVGITVLARPANAHVSACVKAAVESLNFPSHPRLDVTRTHFDAVSGR